MNITIDDFIDILYRYRVVGHGNWKIKSIGTVMKKGGYGYVLYAVDNDGNEKIIEIK